MWLLQFSKKEVKSKPKSLGLKKQPSRCETKMGGQGLLLLIHLKIMVINLTAKHCYCRHSRPSDVDGIKSFDKDDQGAVHCSFYLNVLRPGHCYQKF